MAKTISDRVKNAMVRASTLAWMKERGIKNEKNKRIRVDEKSNFYFLKEIYQAFDEEDDVAVQKPSPVISIGASLIRSSIFILVFIGRSVSSNLQFVRLLLPTQTH